MATSPPPPTPHEPRLRRPCRLRPDGMRLSCLVASLSLVAGCASPLAPPPAGASPAPQPDATSEASPAGEPAQATGAARPRDGANHRLGDDSFVERYGRPPGAADAEAQRMRTHLLYVRGLLGARPPTRPELAETRQRMLGYLDDYIAKGLTPRNDHVARRNPVFIDDFGTICAVGFLIERSAGRALAETIAAAHRHDYLEDIAAAMPEVRAWIDASGLQLDELASIQPGYEAELSAYSAWSPKTHPPDGKFVSAQGLSGEFRDGRMEGTWKRVAGAKVVGSGEFVHGAARWRSYHGNGELLADGRYAANQPQGPWRFFHASGRLAAEGSFARGEPEGTWRFYHDTPRRTLVSVGYMGAGYDKLGVWKHYDEDGKLIATARHSMPSGWTWSTAQLLDVTPGADGVRHAVHQGSATGDFFRLDGIFGGKDKLYVWSDSDGVYDTSGRHLTRAAGGWRAVSCSFTASMKRAAQAGNVPALHALLRGHKPSCGPDEPGKPVDAERSRRIDALLASVVAVRSPTPAFVRAFVPTQGDEPAEAAQPEAPPRVFDQIAEPPKMAGDMAKVLAATMRWYIEWPQVDRQFITVFQSLPGYRDEPPKAQ